MRDQELEFWKTVESKYQTEHIKNLSDSIPMILELERFKRGKINYPLKIEYATTDMSAHNDSNLYEAGSKEPRKFTIIFDPHDFKRDSVINVEVIERLGPGQKDLGSNLSVLYDKKQKKLGAMVAEGDFGLQEYDDLLASYFESLQAELHSDFPPAD